jgi:molecular chaperone GrpE
MTDRNDQSGIRRIKVQDKRHHATSSEAHQKYGAASEEAAGTTEEGRPDDEPVVEGELVEEPAELTRLREENEQLRYHVAELENKRKRMMRDQTDMVERANKQLIQKLLTVLDNFDRALEHADDPSGLEIVHKELLRVLSDEGLEEIPAKGRRFDYHVHEAMASHEDPSVTEETVTDVYRKGYRHKDQVLRPAMVVVARPAQQTTDQPEES